MKLLPILIVAIVLFPVTQAYASWTEHTNTRYIDLDGDFAEEIIIEAKRSAGSNHYIEDLRIFKDAYPELELIFSIRTLDSHFGPFVDFTPQDTISEVEFTEPDPDNGTRDIIVKSKRIYYKDDENKIVDKEEDLGSKIYKWNGKKFVESD
jgi:hypothetical protein